MKTKSKAIQNKSWESGYSYAYSELKKCVEEYLEKTGGEPLDLLHDKLLQHLDKKRETNPMSIWVMDKKLKEEMIVFSKEYLDKVGVVGGNEGGGQWVVFNNDWEIHFFEECDEDAWRNDWYAYAHPAEVDEEDCRLVNEDNPFPLLKQQEPIKPQEGGF